MTISNKLIQVAFYCITIMITRHSCTICENGVKLHRTQHIMFVQLKLIRYLVII